jgi:ABC-type transport system substrate-binding protein
LRVAVERGVQRRRTALRSPGQGDLWQSPHARIVGGGDVPAQPRLRRAVNYAIDRTALARVGADLSPLPDKPADLYIPRGIPGASSQHVYPLHADAAAARRLARGQQRETAVLFTCNSQPCAPGAQIIRTGLTPLGICVKIDELPQQVLYRKLSSPGARFDLATVGWGADYLDYFVYSRLDREIARRDAPFVACGIGSIADLFSARIGYQTFGPYGADLAALCIRDRG